MVTTQAVKRVCATCSKMLVRRKGECDRDFVRRRFCGRNCSDTRGAKEHPTLVYLGSFRYGLGPCAECRDSIHGDIVVSVLYAGKVYLRRVCSECLPQQFKEVRGVV